MARVMIYGYESAVANSKNVQTIEDLATTFQTSLLALAAAPKTRPIILIGHSLGGLIIKQVKVHPCCFEMLCLLTKCVAGFDIAIEIKDGGR